MSESVTTENISALSATPLESPGGWEITFRSDNAGMFHQLYVNGSLADWTDTPEQRSFLLDAADEPLEVAIAAVGRADREEDCHEAFADSPGCDGWVYRASVVRSPAFRAGSEVLLLGDRATGELDDSPLARVDAWPDWLGRWAWGEDRFGAGGFGYDGEAAPGLGEAAFGAGMLGLDADLIELAAPLGEEGTHQLVLRTETPDGQTADSDTITVQATPPPTPHESVQATTYNTETQMLTMQL